MNNYNYMNYNWYQNFNRNNTNYNNENLFNPKEGFEKGNMFSNLYNEYKNYKPAKLTPRSEQEKMLMDLQTISFAAHDLNLYLDTHPTDQSMLMLFNDYMRKKDELTKEYERRFGPMTVMGNDSTTSFEWVDTTWPWEVKNV